MVKMKLSVSAVRFMENRLAISEWLLNRKISVELHFWPNYQKVQLKFEKTSHAMDFAMAFEDV
jgi:hypothetical protein